jgi:hypothetical protein
MFAKAKAQSPERTGKYSKTTWETSKANTNYTARSATTKRTFIATERTLMDTRSISAKNVGISGLKTIPTNCPGVVGKKNIQAVLFVGKRCMCIMIANTTSTIPARTGSAGTPFLYQSLQLFPLRPCPSSLERQILSGCAIRSM